MPTIRQFLAGAVLALLIAPGVHAGQAIGLDQKASLQAAMQQHINRNLVNDAYLQLNMETGEVRPLHPVTAHPIILKMGEYFVLCADFRDEKGNSVNVDFYLARQDQSYVVFHSAVDERDQLMALMKQGKAERLE